MNLAHLLTGIHPYLGAAVVALAAHTVVLLTVWLAAWGSAGPELDALLHDPTDPTDPRWTPDRGDA